MILLFLFEIGFHNMPPTLWLKFAFAISQKYFNNFPNEIIYLKRKILAKRQNISFASFFIFIYEAFESFGELQFI